MDEKNPFFDTMPDNSISLINKKVLMIFLRKFQLILNLNVSEQIFTLMVWLLGKKEIGLVKQ